MGPEPTEVNSPLERCDQRGPTMRGFESGELVEVTSEARVPGRGGCFDERLSGRTAAEIAFCGIGPAAEAFIKAAAAAGNTSLAGDLDELAGLEAAHGRDALVTALERAVHFGRFRAHDVRSILAAGTGVARPTRPGDALIVDLPSVATRPLSAYAIGDQT